MQTQSALSAGILLILLAGCSAKPVQYAERLSATPACCAQLSSAQYQPLNYDQTLHIDVGRKGSQARLFGGEKSFFAAARLPEYSGPYELKIESLPHNGQLFAPRIQFLNANYQVVKQIPPAQLKYSNGILRGNFFVNRDEGYRYLIAYTASADLSKSQKMRVAGTNTTSVYTGGVLFNINQGYDEQTAVKTAPGGKLRLQVKPYKPRTLQ